jgi:hypothetical protein
MIVKLFPALPGTSSTTSNIDGNPAGQSGPRVVRDDAVADAAATGTGDLSIALVILFVSVT